jgi:hypothetical protein
MRLGRYRHAAAVFLCANPPFLKVTTVPELVPVPGPGPGPIPVLLLVHTCCSGHAMSNLHHTKYSLTNHIQKHKTHNMMELNRKLYRCCVNS